MRLYINLNKNELIRLAHRHGSVWFRLILLSVISEYANSAHDDDGSGSVVVGTVVSEFTCLHCEGILSWLVYCQPMSIQR